MSLPSATDRGRRGPIARHDALEPGRPAPGWSRTAILAAVAASYFACAAVATDPVIRTFATELPGELADPLEHLWIMRWAKSCLAEGRSPFFATGLNYPTGVPLGYFPTMHLQTLAYLALGLFTSNDVAIFNAIWFFGFVSTGLGTFVLARSVVGSFWPSWLGGLGTMLCGPMLMHAHGHLETMQMGGVPLFLLTWLRFVDRPSRDRLAWAAGLYLVVVASAPYFAVLCVFPAAWYVAWSTWARDPGGRRAWLAGRAAWLVGFGLVVLPGLATIFAPQVWAATHGFSMARSRSQFNQYGAPLWSSFVPSPRHRLGSWLSPDLFRASGFANKMSECSSYLGVVTLGLLAYGAARRVAVPRAGYWWSVLGLMVVLSWGAQVEVGSKRIELPAGWIYGVFPPFHLIRVPARFNLFAAACAAVPAAAALKALLDPIGPAKVRGFVIVALTSALMVDLAMVPFPTSAIPPIPACYTDGTIREGSAIVDAPMFGSNEGQVFSSLWGYWQSYHRAATSAGYPGLPNVAFEAEVVRASPWWAGRLADPSYLADPARESFGPVAGVDARDYAWLFLAAHRFDSVVVHQGVYSDAKYAAGLGRIKALIAEARRSEDADSAVFERSRLKPPGRPVWLCGEGWRPNPNRSVAWRYGVLDRARIVVFLPSPGTQTLELVGCSGFGRARVVRLVEAGRELARWSVPAGSTATLGSLPLTLAAGLHEWSIESDGADAPVLHADRLDDARTPYSLRVDSVRLLGN